MSAKPRTSRLDDLISWFAASVLVTAGVIYALNLQEDRSSPAPERVLPDPTPVQEPLSLRKYARTARPRAACPGAI